MSLHEKEKKEAIDRNDEVHKRVEKTQHGTITSYNWPSRQLHQNANWLAISTIEAFFSWTEHLFVLIAIIKGEVSDGSSILDLANSNWHTKFSCALDTKKPAAKKYHDELTIVRRQIRNFVAHGAIGKDCQTFEFHSSVGAVPVSVFYQDNKPKLKLTEKLTFDENKVLLLIKNFIQYMWQSDVAPAMYYAMESYLPIFLTFVNDGSYKSAMKSMEDMENFVRYLSNEVDKAANMDW